MRYRCYKLQFSSYLQVVYDISVSKAGYILNIFNIVSCGWGVVLGLCVSPFVQLIQQFPGVLTLASLMRITDRYKVST